MPVYCDYLAVQWDNRTWVRNEMCQFAKIYNGVDGVFIGARLEFRPILSYDQGKCIDLDKRTHMRYKIGDKEWICLID